MAKKIKKDFDKEKMYRQIMPSMEPAAASPPPVEAIAAAAVETNDEFDGGEVQLHNFMESLLREKLEHTIKVLGVCDCPRCRMDIMALALNQMPPAYFVASPGDTAHLKKLRGVYEVKATASLIKSIQQVKSSPRH